MPGVKDMLSVWWLRVVVIDISCMRLEAWYEAPAGLTNLLLFEIVAC